MVKVPNEVLDLCASVNENLSTSATSEILKWQGSLSCYRPCPNCSDAITYTWPPSPNQQYAVGKCPHCSAVLLVADLPFHFNGAMGPSAALLYKKSGTVFSFDALKKSGLYIEITKAKNNE